MAKRKTKSPADQPGADPTSPAPPAAPATSGRRARGKTVSEGGEPAPELSGPATGPVSAQAPADVPAPRARSAKSPKPKAQPAADAKPAAQSRPVVESKPAAPKRRAATSPDPGRATPTLKPARGAAADAGRAVALPEAPGVAAPKPARRRAAPKQAAGGGPRSILMVASEMAPFAKTGGLADVAGALPGALGRLGHRVRVAMPRYQGMDVDGAPAAAFPLTIGPETYDVQVFERPLDAGGAVWMIDIPVLFEREGYYGIGGHDHPDNPRRFAALTRAAFETVQALDFAPDVVHAHDWQAGLAPAYLRTRYASDPVLGGVPCVFTIHNAAYKGLCDPGWLPALDLGWELFNPQGLEYWNLVSFLKAGINFSEKITTVSRRYADEILTPEFAFGFEGILGARRADLVGIPNGIDTDLWNPAADPHIPVPYSAGALDGKRSAKRALLQAFGLAADDAALNVPVVGMVSRMIEQKGLGLIADAAGELPHLGARFVVMGTGDPYYEQLWRSLAAQFPDRIAVHVGFEEELSHLVEAGSDIFMMPSLFEPCGLNQMYSLRYGTLPLVRATGGLDDTVQNYDPAAETGNGFKFWEASGSALVGTLRWALRVYAAPDVWSRLQREAMAADFSWSGPARVYEGVYEDALARVGRGRGRSLQA